MQNSAVNGSSPWAAATHRGDPYEIQVPDLCQIQPSLLWARGSEPAGERSQSVSISLSNKIKFVQSP